MKTATWVETYCPEEMCEEIIRCFSGDTRRAIAHYDIEDTIHTNLFRVWFIFHFDIDEYDFLHEWMVLLHQVVYARAESEERNKLCTK